MGNDFPILSFLSFRPSPFHHLPITLSAKNRVVARKQDASQPYFGENRGLLSIRKRSESVSGVGRINYRDELPAARPGWEGYFTDRPQLPYVIPLMAYLAVMIPGSFGSLGGIDWADLWRRWNPILYPLKTVFAAVLLGVFWRFYTRIRWTHLATGALVGLLGTLLWIGVTLGYQSLCNRIGLVGWGTVPHPYNPVIELPSTSARWTYLCLRVIGPSLVVPVMEELFFRDFLMRLFINPLTFKSVPIGTFTWGSLLGMSALFGLNHGAMWPAGIAYGLLMGVLLIRTKSLGSCIVAHGMTNWSLYIYVIYCRDWQFM